MKTEAQEIQYFSQHQMVKQVMMAFKPLSSKSIEHGWHVVAYNTCLFSLPSTTRSFYALPIFFL